MNFFIVTIHSTITDISSGISFNGFVFQFYKLTVRGPFFLRSLIFYKLLSQHSTHFGYNIAQTFSTYA